MSKIDFEEILFNYEQLDVHVGGGAIVTVIHSDDAKEAMKEACRQVLDIAAENAEAEVFMPSHPHLHGTKNAVVIKQSILSIKEEL